MAAAIEHILTRTLRLHLRPHPQFSFFHHHRRLSTSSTPPESEPVQISPISYQPKPKPEPDQHPQDAQGEGQGESLPRRQLFGADFARSMSREDLRFVKDGAVISPISYPKKVAPLPEDRVVEGEREREGEEVRKGREGMGELEGERRRIVGTEATRRVFRVVEEEVVPFPTLIREEKKQKEKKVYDLQEAIRAMKASASNKQRNFVETVEAHVNLGIDRRRSDLGVSGAIVLPHGTGKNVRVAVFSEGAAAEEARAAGADIVGADELIQEIKNGGKINFDKCIATHSMMQRVASISKVLRGLTPNTKKGTVTNDIAAAVKQAKQGLLDFKMKDSIVHVGIGKVNFPEESLRENIGAFVNALLLAKPPDGSRIFSLNSIIIKSCRPLCSVASPAVKVLYNCAADIETVPTSLSFALSDP
ncbi:Large ribosomal subunit protein uL1-like protein [Drosera capensis]